MHGLEIINSVVVEPGLKLNIQKCELISTSVIIVNSVISSYPNLQLTTPETMSLIDSPLGDENSISTARESEQL